MHILNPVMAGLILVLSLIFLVFTESFAATSVSDCAAVLAYSESRRTLIEDIVVVAAPDVFVLHSKPLRKAIQYERWLSDAQKILLVAAVKEVVDDFKLRASDKERPLYRFYEGGRHLLWLDQKVTALLSEWEIPN